MTSDFSLLSYKQQRQHSLSTKTNEKRGKEKVTLQGLNSLE